MAQPRRVLRGYWLRKELWSYTANRIAVRFEYESHYEDGQWWRSHPYDRIATPSRPPSPGSPRPQASRWPHRNGAGQARATLTLEGDAA